MYRNAVLALALSSCSLIGTTRPDPPPYVTRPTCNASYARPAWDTVFAIGGAGLAGFGALQAVQAPDAQGNNANLGPGIVAIGAGVAVAALFVTSAALGYPRVSACKGAVADWRGQNPEEIVAEAERPEDRVKKAARKALPCSDGQLEIEGLSFSRNDGRCDHYRWAAVEVRGCGLATWCGEPTEIVKCGAPPDLDIAARTVATETGCPQERIVPLARTVEVQPGRRGADGMATNRLDACGQIYACNVPMSVPDKNDTLFPALGSGSNFSCRPVQSLAPPPPTPSP